MNRCPNCGWPNDEENRFCENCGADLEHLRSQDDSRRLPETAWPAPPAQNATPQAYPPDRTETESARLGEWQMAPLPPQEVITKKRRTWLWVTVVLALMVVFMCAGSIFWLGYTDSGKHFQTEVAVRETEQADK